MGYYIDAIVDICVRNLKTPGVIFPAFMLVLGFLFYEAYRYYLKSAIKYIPKDVKMNIKQAYLTELERDYILSCRFSQSMFYLCFMIGIFFEIIFCIIVWIKATLSFFVISSFLEFKELIIVKPFILSLAAGIIITLFRVMYSRIESNNAFVKELYDRRRELIELNELDK